MKLFAQMVIGNELIKVDVWNVIEGRKTDPEKWGTKAKYISTHAKKEFQRPMVFVKNNNNKAFFRYKSKDIGAQNGEGHEESLTHELCKEIISKLTVLNFKVGNQYYKIYVKEADVEFPLVLNDNRYVIDIFFKFEKSEPQELFIKWKGLLAVEMYYSHEVGPVKKKDLLDSGIAAFEVPIHDAFDIDKKYPFTKEQAEKKINFIKSCYEDKIFAQLISDPSSKEYEEMKEVEKLKDDIRVLSDTSQTLANHVKQQNKAIDALTQENNDLKCKISYQNGVISKINNEMEVFKRTLWYKLFKWFSKD